MGTVRPGAPGGAPDRPPDRTVERFLQDVLRTDEESPDAPTPDPAGNAGHDCPCRRVHADSPCGRHHGDVGKWPTATSTGRRRTRGTDTSFAHANAVTMSPTATLTIAGPAGNSVPGPAVSPCAANVGPHTFDVYLGSIFVGGFRGHHLHIGQDPCRCHGRFPPAARRWSGRCWRGFSSADQGWLTSGRAQAGRQRATPYGR
jgi:hypothetical protein